MPLGINDPEHEPYEALPERCHARLLPILTASTTVDPSVYSGLASASQLQPNRDDSEGRVPYRYHGNVDRRQYDELIIDPVTVYAGPDNQFVKMGEEDKSVLANYMQTTFAETLKSRFAIVSTPGPRTLRPHLTLTGAKDTTPILGPLSHDGRWQNRPVTMLGGRVGGIADHPQ